MKSHPLQTKIANLLVFDAVLVFWPYGLLGPLEGHQRPVAVRIVNGSHVRCLEPAGFGPLPLLTRRLTSGRHDGYSRRHPVDNTASGTAQKALKLNLDALMYGTFAEIGAGQEVAR